MNYDYLLPLLNNILKMDLADVSEFGVDALQRANLIMEIHIKNAGVQALECRPTPAPQGEQVLFVDLEHGALFHLADDDRRTMEKLASGFVRHTVCPSGLCPGGESLYNAIDKGGHVHVCPGTPVVEVLFQ